MHCQEMFIYIFSIFFLINAIKSDSSGGYIIEQLPSEDSSNIVTSYRKDPSIQIDHTVVINVSPAAAKFCQIRVYFDRFNVGEPDQQGNCESGLRVYGHNDTNNVPEDICGENDLQHIFLNFWWSHDPITLEITETSTSDDWQMTVTQIDCTNEINIAPPECLQYFPEATGTVRSFNYRSLESIADPPVTYQLWYQHYYVCLGRGGSYYNSISWTRGDNSTDYYFVTKTDIEAVDPDLVGTVDAALFDVNCTGADTFDDYVQILSGNYTDADGEEQTSDLYCGAGFPSLVTSTVKPFRLRVLTNTEEDPREGSVGFSLSYTLNT